jgi:hypothetical protein
MMNGRAEMKERILVNIVVSGPIGDGYCSCRSCGGKSERYQIVGLAETDAQYWRCVDCTNTEVVKGTPMSFGEPVFPGPGAEDAVRKLVDRWNERRKTLGLPLITNTPKTASEIQLSFPADVVGKSGLRCYGCDIGIVEDGGQLCSKCKKDS